MELATVHTSIHQSTLNLTEQSSSTAATETRGDSDETVLPTYEQSETQSPRDAEGHTFPEPDEATSTPKEQHTMALPLRITPQLDQRLAIAETLNQEFESFRTVASSLATVINRVEHPDQSVQPLFQTSHNSSPNLASSEQMVEIGMILPRRGCPPTCKCSCHSRTRTAYRFKMPTMLQGMLGTLLLSGMPINSDRCSLTQCSQARISSLKMHYIFPSWFATMALRASV
jgi:hypothetical protein